MIKREEKGRKRVKGGEARRWLRERRYGREKV